MARNKTKADQRADNRGGPWAGLPHCVLDSSAYSHLSVWARSTLFEVVRSFNGYNNGEIAISQRQLADRLGTSNFRQITRALAQLMKHGFIDVESEGRWKERQARQYRLTFINTGRAGNIRPATNEYLHWQPQKSGADTVSAKRAISAEAASAGQENPADTVSATTHENPPFLAPSAAEAVSALIDKPYQGEKPEPIKTAISGPENHVGQFSIEMPEEHLRGATLTIVKQRGNGFDASLASAAGIDKRNLDSFLHQRIALPAASLARLCRALNQMAA